VVKCFDMYRHVGAACHHHQIIGYSAACVLFNLCCVIIVLFNLVSCGSPTLGHKI
jgi:hypothetical protein